MKSHFKPRIKELYRFQTSVGRDLENGIRLDRNERAFNFKDETLDEICKRFTSSVLSAVPDTNRLYEKIALYLGTDRQHIFLTEGITGGIKIMFDTLTNPGDNTIVLHPTFAMYSVYAKMYQVEYRIFGFKDNLLPDWDSLDKNMDDKTSLVVLPNPNQPIECLFSLEEIKRIADRCKENQSVLVVDEAYYHFGAPTVLELIELYDNLVVMRSFSKAFGLAGIRLGYMLSSAENIKYFSNTRSTVETNALSMSVAEYMLDHQEIMFEYVNQVKDGSAYIRSEFDKLGIQWFGGNVTNAILIYLEDEERVNSLVKYLRDRKIYIRGAFPPPCQHYARVSIGPRDIMEVFKKAFKEWLSSISPEKGDLISHGSRVKE